MTQYLTQSLGLAPMEDDNKKIIKKEDAEIIEDSTELTAVDTTSGSEDFQNAKKNIRDLIELGTASVADLFEIARSSQNSKDYEALTKMIKTMLEANREIVDLENVDLDIKQKKKHLNKNTDEVSGQITHHNNTIVFTGTTEDMLKQIAQLKKK